MAEETTQIIATLEDGPSEMDGYVFSEENGDRRSRARKIAHICVAAAIALVSIFVLAGIASSPETYAGTIETLDEKKGNVMALAASSAVASVAVTVIPGDIATPIATELADLSSDFGFIVAAILLEKYLLTVLGLATFGLLVPIACLLYILGVLKPQFSGKLNGYVVKLVLFALILIAVIPASTALSDTIDSTYETSAQLAVEELNAELALEGQGAAEGAEAAESAEGGFNLFDFIADASSAAADAIGGTATAAVDKAALAFNNLLEAFAVMIVTSCIVPILMLLFALWLANFLLGVSIDVPMGALKSRAWRKPVAKKRQQLSDMVGKKNAGKQSAGTQASGKQSAGAQSVGKQSADERGAGNRDSAAE